jgi:hypothetical protein
MRKYFSWIVPFLVSVVIFVTFFGCGTAQLTSIQFHYLFEEQPSSDKQSFVVMKDGSVIKGTNVDGTSGLLVKDALKIDGRSIPADQAEGFQSKGTYFKRIKNNYAKRLVQGKINVYEKRVPAAEGGEKKVILFQKGDNGTLDEFINIDQLKTLVSDCPQAYEMLNKSKSDLKKALKKDDYYYFQNVILTYNSCK